jgi:uncharacterized membrane protein YeaQ/YmgE (transglycosylase-associated protein family)
VKVTGTEPENHPVVERLRRLGARVHAGHSPGSCPKSAQYLIVCPETGRFHRHRLSAARRGLVESSPVQWLGHFMQGLVPALIARELFVRLRVVDSAGWRFSIIVLICMGISALYELREWTTALIAGAAANAFLGTQGDPWDTQQDMLMALLGALCALVFFSYWQNRQMRTLPSRW